jgi:hypothetical protein
MPVPPGAAGNFAGLLTVDLPATVRKGQVYTIVVRQVTNFTLGESHRQIAPTEGALSDQTPFVAQLITERRVLGAFQLTVPVRIEETLLEPEERLLAIMRWIDEGIPANDRWAPVFNRYLSQIADRVQGFGGHPATILPSSTGSIPNLSKHRPKLPDLGFTGKVAGIIYDRFGDFEGFLLLTEEGNTESFECRGREVETLVHRAWVERIVIRVFVHHGHPSSPVSIVFLRL